MAQHFTPSAYALNTMVANAMAKFDAARALALKEQRRDELVARGLARAIRARHYEANQRGFVIFTGWER